MLKHTRTYSVPLAQRHEQCIWPSRLLSDRASAAYRHLYPRHRGCFTSYDLRNFGAGALLKLYEHGLLAVYSDTRSRVECGYFTI